MAKTAADCTTMADIRENIDRVDRALMALFAERWSFIGRAAEIEYWPTFDPTLVEGSREARLAAYREVRDTLAAHIAQRFPR